MSWPAGSLALPGLAWMNEAKKSAHRSRARTDGPGLGSIVGVDLEGPHSVVGVRLADPEIEPDPGSTRLDVVIDHRNRLHAVEISGDHIADDGRLDDVAVLDAVLLAYQLGQRRPAADR